MTELSDLVNIITKIEVHLFLKYKAFFNAKTNCLLAGIQRDAMSANVLIWITLS